MGDMIALRWPRSERRVRRNDMEVGLAIKAALERAEQHEQLARRKLRVRLRMDFGDGHHAKGPATCAG